MPNALFGPEVRIMLEEENTKGLKAFCESLHPSTVAETLTEDFSIEDCWKVLSLSGIREQAAVFEYFPMSWQVQLVGGTGRENMARLIEQMSHDDRVDLLRRLEPRMAENLIRLVDEADRRDIASLFRYDEDRVGAMMTTEYAWLPDNYTAAQAIDRLRTQAPDRETIYYIYVLDETTRRLMGIVSLKTLILADRMALIRQLMSTDLETLRGEDYREKAVEAFSRLDYLAMPVVDSEYRLIGIVTHDDALDAVQQAATEDLQKQGAVGPFTGSYLEAPFLKLWWNRTFWLSCLFIAEMLTFNAMAAFDDEIKRISILAFFVPLCIATGGNSGTQAASLITRAMALGQVTVSDWWRVLRRELLLGGMMGLALGTIAFGRVWLVPDKMLENGEGQPSSEKIAVMFTVALAVGMICLAGTIIGSLLPLVFRKLRIDPALASSPFVATFVDVTGIVIYFKIAQLYLI